MIFTPNTVSFSLNRGDSYILPIVINKGTQLKFEPYTLQEQDRLYIGIMQPNQSFEDAIVKKVYTEDDELDENGNILFKLSPRDTEYLMTGKYYISIKLKQFDTVTTILPMKEFWITGSSLTQTSIAKDEDDENTIIWDGGEII